MAINTELLAGRSRLRRLLRTTRPPSRRLWEGFPGFPAALRQRANSRAAPFAVPSAPRAASGWDFLFGESAWKLGEGSAPRCCARRFLPLSFASLSLAGLVSLGRSGPGKDRDSLGWSRHVTRLGCLDRRRTMSEVGAGQSASRRQVAAGGLLLPRLFCLLLVWTKESAGLADFSGKGTRPLAAAVPPSLSAHARQDGREPMGAGEPR